MPASQAGGLTCTGQNRNRKTERRAQSSIVHGINIVGAILTSARRSGQIAPQEIIICSVH